MTESLPSATLSSDVDKIMLGERTIYLVGTAHISKESADLAERLILEVKPNCVAVELCEGRYKSLCEPDRWKNTDIVEVIRTGQSSVLIAQLILAAFQKKLGDQLNIRPGEEMMRAVSAGKQVGATLMLADRNIKTTLKRTWAALGFRSMFTLMHALVMGAFTDKSISEEQINSLKEKSNVDALMAEFTAVFPRIKEPLISERDIYLAEKIQQCQGPITVAVVGAGHVPGIKTWIGKSIDLTPLEIIPPKSWQKKLLAYSIPGSIIALIGYGFSVGGSETGLSMASAWFWATSISAAIGALIALAHPLTILACFLVAPFTAINPFLRPGWVGALTEAFLCRPRVADFENVAKDITTVRGVWRNRVSRILLLLVVVNLTALFGALYGVKLIASFL